MRRLGTLRSLFWGWNRCSSVTCMALTHTELVASLFSSCSRDQWNPIFTSLIYVSRSDAAWLRWQRLWFLLFQLLEVVRSLVCINCWASIQSALLGKELSPSQAAHGYVSTLKRMNSETWDTLAQTSFVGHGVFRSETIFHPDDMEDDFNWIVG